MSADGEPDVRRRSSIDGVLHASHQGRGHRAGGDHRAGGKGRRDRITILPQRLRADLVAHISSVKRLHDADLAAGHGSVALPARIDGQVSPRRLGVAVAMGVPCHPPVSRFQEWASSAPPPSRVGSPAIVQGRCAAGRAGEARQLPQPPALVCDPLTRVRLRHPDHPRTARPSRCGHDDDLHPRPESRGSWRQEPFRSVRASGMGRPALIGLCRPAYSTKSRLAIRPTAVDRSGLAASPSKTVTSGNHRYRADIGLGRSAYY